MSALASSYSEDVVVTGVSLSADCAGDDSTAAGILEYANYAQALERMKANGEKFNFAGTTASAPRGNNWWNL